MKKIKIHSGLSIEIDDSPRHPINAVLKAKEIIDNLTSDIELYSNHPDFVSALHYYGEYKGHTVIHYLNNQLSNLEEVFEDFNKALEMIGDLTPDWKEDGA